MAWQGRQGRGQQAFRVSPAGLDQSVATSSGCDVRHSGDERTGNLEYRELAAAVVE